MSLQLEQLLLRITQVDVVDGVISRKRERFRDHADIHCELDDLPADP